MHVVREEVRYSTDGYDWLVATVEVLQEPEGPVRVCVHLRPTGEGPTLTRAEFAAFAADVRARMDRVAKGVANMRLAAERRRLGYRRIAGDEEG